MLEYSAAFSHLKIIGWHFEAGWGEGREGERDAVCQKGDWSRGSVMTSRSSLSFFLSCFPSLSPGAQTKGSASCSSWLCHPGAGSPSREGWPHPARGPCSSSGTALLWLLVGNPEQGLPGGAAGAVSGALLCVWGREPRQGGWDWGARTGRRPYGMGLEHPSCRLSMGPMCPPADPGRLAALALISFCARSPVQ